MQVDSDAMARPVIGGLVRCTSERGHDFEGIVTFASGRPGAWKATVRVEGESLSTAGEPLRQGKG